MDAVGTVAVEDFSRKVRKLARQEVIEQGFTTSRHFSPGYSGWDVSQQEIVFKSIPSDNIGVRLSKGFMMLPQKSLSWVIGADGYAPDVASAVEKAKKFLNNNLPEIFIPSVVKERMIGKDIGEGIKISQEFIDKIRKFKEVAGIHVFPLRDMDLVCRLLN